MEQTLIEKNEITILASSGNGNAAVLHAPHGNILLDAGLPLNELEVRLRKIDLTPHDISAILLTHSHCDHAQGAGPFALKYHIPIYGSKPLPALSEGLYRKQNNGDVFELCGIRIIPFPVRHNTINFGYVFECPEKKVGWLTDCGGLNESAIGLLSNCNAIAVEANYDETLLQKSDFPFFLKKKIRENHFSNRHAAELLKKIATPELHRVQLLHLHREINAPQLAGRIIREELNTIGRADIRVELFSEKDQVLFL